MKKFAFVFFVLVWIVSGCVGEYPFWQEHLDGHYVVVDIRDVVKGPVDGLEFLGGVFDLVTSVDYTAVITGKWNTKAKVIGLNMKFEPVDVYNEDGTEYHFVFGLIEGHRNSYVLTGTYHVSGMVIDPYTKKLVEYEAKGEFNAMRNNQK